MEIVKFVLLFHLPVLEHLVLQVKLQINCHLYYSCIFRLLSLERQPVLTLVIELFLSETR